MSLFAEIAIPAAVDMLFTYSVPLDLQERIQCGQHVRISFGTRTMTGFVIRLSKTSPQKKLKPISTIIDEEPIFTTEMMNVLQWIADYYIAPLGEVMKSALPQGLTTKEPNIKTERGIVISYEKKREWEQWKNGFANIKLTAKQQQVFDVLLQSESGFISLDVLKTHAYVTDAVIKTLHGHGFLTISFREVIRAEQYPPSEHEKQILNITLNAHQQKAYDTIEKEIVENVFHPFLLFGITGSGKTQVYIEAIREVLRKGKTAIVLVPEISLTPQAVRRFQLCFGEMVTVIHSQMSQGERYDSWRLTKSGVYKIVVGPRSAIFAPLKNLGLIVVDEEQESSYKQYDMMPRYNARDVAIMRGKENNAVVILGSATPSVETYANAKSGKYSLLELPERADNAQLPKIFIVDMRLGKATDATIASQPEPPKKKKFSSLTPFLVEHIEERLKKKEGVILLQNRRGFSAFVECPSCGFVEMCSNCSLSLTYHKTKYLLRCHYCGFSKRLPLVCEKCGSPSSLYKGVGTQRVEEELQTLFPAAKTVRMDFDTTTKKGAHEKILSSFGNKEIDILLGTQMVAKGLDFPHVTLVGVINADLQMLLPDFRAAERTFQLLTQVAGRAGRSALAGEVVIQTYQPEHYCLNFVTQHDSVGFFNVELFHRKQLLYPPFSRIAVVEFKGHDENETLLTAQVFTRFLKHLNGTVSVLGPSPAAIEKIQNFFRFHILLKSDKEKDKSGNYLHTVLRNAIEEFKQTPYGKSKKVVMLIDIDPSGMM